MNGIKSIKCIGVLAVVFAGLFGASAAFAHGSYGNYGHGYGHYKHKRYHHDYDDDDDGYYRGGYHRRHGGYYRGHRRGGYYGHGGYYGGHRRGGHYYGHSYTDLGIHDVTFTDLGGQLAVDGVVTGFDGDNDVVITLEAMADVRSNCAAQTNRIAAEPLDIQSQAMNTYRLVEAQDGQLQVAVTSDDSNQHAKDLVTCPGSRTLEVTQIDFLDARVDITQGDQVLTLLCTFTNPTVDGEVAPENVDCSAF